MKSPYIDDDASFIKHLAEDPPPFPTAVNLELTTRCNLRCVMCPKTAGLPRTPPNRTMPEEVFNRVMEQIVPRVYRVDVVGDGEVLLALPLLRKLLERAREMRVLVNVCSNGVLLDSAVSSELIRLGLADINVSLDAVEPETYAAIRGADLDQVLANLRTLRDLKRAAGSQLPRLHFSMVGMMMNIGQFPAMIQLAAELDVSSVTLQAMGEFEAVAHQSVYQRDPALGQRMFNEAVALGNKLGIRVNLWPPGQFDAAVPNAAKTELSTSPDRWRKDCEFPWDVPYVTTTGDILPCCAMSSRGNIQKKNFLDIWNGQQYRQLRASIRSVSPPAACEACPGRGWSAPSPPRTELVMGKDDRQLGLGWFELENHSTMSYRWTRQRATLFLLNSAQPVLSITWAGEQHPGAESQGVLRVQDQNVSRFVLDSAKFVEDLFVLPPTDGSLLKVDFELDKCWSPRDVIADSHDPRSLGIKIARVRLEGRRLFVRFANGAQLLGFDLLQTEAAPGSQVPLELFWTCDWPLEAGLVAFVHLQHFATVNWRIPFFITKRLPKPLRSAFQADYVPGASSEFHNRLQPGRIIRDKVMIQIPQDVRPGRYRLGVGLWQPAISPERIRIATADGAISEHAAILTQMTVCSQ